MFDSDKNIITTAINRGRAKWRIILKMWELVVFRGTRYYHTHWYPYVLLSIQTAPKHSHEDVNVNVMWIMITCTIVASGIHIAIKRYMNTPRLHDNSHVNICVYPLLPLLSSHVVRKDETVIQVKYHPQPAASIGKMWLIAIDWSMISLAGEKKDYVQKNHDVYYKLYHCFVYVYRYNQFEK